MAEQQPFKWRHFEAEIILVCVRWYLRYALNYRDLEELMGERGRSVDHKTIYRWVQRYAPELEKRCRPHLRRTTDETTGSSNGWSNQEWASFLLKRHGIP
jgi:transposase, IS6 family